MRLRPATPAPEKIGAVFQRTPPAVLVAWEAHRPYHDRKLAKADLKKYFDTVLALQRAVRGASRGSGYFVLDGYLVGYGGPAFDRKWLIAPDRTPIGGPRWTPLS